MTRDSSAPRSAWIDAGNGVAGDMLLAAFVDAGASLEAVTAAVEAVLPDTVRISVRQVTRAGLRATKVDVTPVRPDAHHRDWRTIRELIAKAAIAAPVAAMATAVFQALADSEARAHGIDADQVHFHEVGAWDSIADVVGVCAAIDDLGLAGLSCGVIAVGSGTVNAAHGEIPVPVPAVTHLALGWPVRAGGSGELATPTGVALVTTLCQSSPALPDGVLDAVGIGAGTRDDPQRPNVVRVLLGRFAESGTDRADAAGSTAPTLQDAVELCANVDDLDPRLWPGVVTALLAAGASDAWLTPIVMKKGRPAQTLHALCAPEATESVRDLLFEVVPTLGLRETPVRKWVLDRQWVSLDVDGSRVRIKLGLRAGRILTATPEFVDVAAAAAASGRTQRHLLAQAIAAAERAGLVAGAEAPPSA